MIVSAPIYMFSAEVFALDEKHRLRGLVPQRRGFRYNLIARSSKGKRGER